MKNLLFTLLLCPFLLFAQDEMENENQDTEKEFNKFSIELNVGLNRPDNYFSPGYFQTDVANEYAFSSINHFDLGLRYMFSEKFGLKLDAGYDIFEPEGDESLPYESNLLRIGFQGVVNFRSILNFDSFTKKFGLLGHGGVHYSFFNPESQNGVDLGGGDADEVAGFMIGLTPQFKLSNRFVLTADATFIRNYRQHRTWDGGPGLSNLNAEYMNFSLGITAYLGKHDIHADWYVDDESDEFEEEIARLDKKVDDLKDEVDNMEKYDPTVVPAAIENYVTNYVDDSISNFNTVESLISDEYIRVFFDFDKDMPNSSSVGDISTLVNFMKNNPDKEIELIGMTDVLGSDSYNDGLSTRRANNVKDILIASGVDESRIEARGNGKNPVYNSKNEYIRMLARTVTVKLKN